MRSISAIGESAQVWFLGWSFGGGSSVSIKQKRKVEEGLPYDLKDISAIEMFMRMELTILVRQWKVLSLM